MVDCQARGSHYLCPLHLHCWVSSLVLCLSFVEYMNNVFYAACFSLGEGCSHTAAIMFKVECAVRLGYTSTTSLPCSWNGMFCRKVTTLYEYLVYTCSIKLARNLQIEPACIVDINVTMILVKDNGSTLNV